MIAPTHLCFGVFNGLVLASLTTTIGAQSFGWNIQTAINAIALSIGALAPDLDSPHSLVSRALPCSRLIHRRWGHRTLLHSFLGLLFAALSFYLLGECINLVFPFSIDSNGTAFFAVGYASHLIADCLSYRGVPFLFPYPISFGYPSVERYRLRTGNKKHELIFSGLSILVGLLYLPVLQRGGAQASLHHAMASIPAAYDDYRKLVNQEALLSFKGSYSLSRKPVEGRGLILEAGPEQFLIFFQGNVLQIGEGGGHIVATAARCIPTGRPVSITSVIIDHEPWGDVLGHLPATVLVSGELTADHPFTLSHPDPAAAGAVSSSGQTLRLDYAQRHELTATHLAPRTNAEKLTVKIR